MLEWDDNKRASNLRSHGLDFWDANLVFDGPILRASAKTVGGEERWQAVGMLDDVYVTVIYTLRGDAIRVISMRRARDGEKRTYCKFFGG